MVELRDILKSEELSTAVTEFESVLRRHARYRKPPDQPSFASIALGRTFHAEKAVPIISAAYPEYPGIREVLFLGFCGWVVSPSEDTVRLALMTHGVLDHIIDAERQVGLIDKFDLRADIAARYILVGPDFLNDVYDPLGAHAGFSHGTLRPILEDWLTGERRSVSTLVKACQIFHYAVDNLNDRSRYRRISVSTIVETLAGYRDDSFVERTFFYEKWSKNKVTVALLYAASTVRKGELTLLNSILSGEVTAKEFLATFDIWVGRARYFCDHVLTELNIQSLTKENIKPLKTVEAVPFGSAISDQHEVNFLRKKFSKIQ